MADSASSTTLTIRTKKKLKKEAQKFFDSLGVSLSSAINLFLNDVVKNQRISVDIGGVTLHSMNFDDLSTDAKSAYKEFKGLKESDKVYFSKK